ncbi:uncharacterized protein LOC109534625 isoform X1 [Dendroctonus ponderosae]|uniref:uncharacterized protein LOC109534625 isoform X1 n=1 Tax=Dendroctonus ponderosae TaxID=77166 RepID=UPI002035A690|nr:uncharacterized protein LOC109534625 isoform X1 [Dendroctonus ponderosae]
MMTEGVMRGYIDVKISSKSRRGFTPWKVFGAWQRQWCEIRRLEDLEVGVELKLKSSEDGHLLNCIQVPRSATLCRTDSRSKQFAFGVFNLRKVNKKAVLFLAGMNESHSQEWMISIRKMLSIASYIPVGESNFRISFVDSSHSRSAGLLGLYGVLNANSQEIMVSDPCTGAPKVVWKWYHFHQFHIQATSENEDWKKIIVMHTSRDFPAGPGQLLVYCPEGPKLLHYLLSRGQCGRPSSGFVSSIRFSRSEGDICGIRVSVLDVSPMYFRSETGSDDSGVPNSSALEETDYGLKSKTESNLVNLGMSEITKTPGGSETEDSYPDLQQQVGKIHIPRSESGISLSSGIYEEIPEDHQSTNQSNTKTSAIDYKHISHIYEDPFELVLDRKLGKYFQAPPLPPRTFKSFTLQRCKEPAQSPSNISSRCNTLPAKDLSKFSQLFNFMPQSQNQTDSEYMVMSPNKNLEKAKIIMSENFYMPMSSPVIHLKNKIVESVYTSMTGNGKKVA